MSTIHGTGSHATTTPDTTHDAETNANSTLARRALATLRIAFGLTFLWAFFDKLLALGFATGYDQDGNLDRFGDAAWINGGSPTEGFLKFGADGPFKGFYNRIAGDAWADWLFMLGLLGIGLALTLGIGMRIAGRRRRAPLPDDVDRRPAPREQPGDRRPHPRRDQHGRPGGLLRRRHLGTRTDLGRDRTGEAEPVPPLNLRSIGPTRNEPPGQHRAARPRHARPVTHHRPRPSLADLRRPLGPRWPGRS